MAASGRELRPWGSKAFHRLPLEKRGFGPRSHPDAVRRASLSGDRDRGRQRTRVPDERKDSADGRQNAAEEESSGPVGETKKHEQEDRDPIGHVVVRFMPDEQGPSQQQKPGDGDDDLLEQQALEKDQEA